MAKGKIEITEQMTAVLMRGGGDQHTLAAKRARSIFDSALGSTSSFEEALAQVYLQGMADVEATVRKRPSRAKAKPTNGPGSHPMATDPDERHRT